MTEKTTKRTAKTRASRVPAWQATFLEALRQTGIISWAAEAAGISRRAAYDRREKCAAFAQAWDAARAAALDALEAEARRRALEGNETLLRFLLRALPSERLRRMAEVPPARPTALATSAADKP